MTDLEISKALALAIGWKPMRVAIVGDKCIADTEDQSRQKTDYGWVRGRIFDYRDWNVIGPIAERYNRFLTPSGQPEKKGQWYSPVGLIYNAVYADTPQKAIALAVIQGL